MDNIIWHIEPTSKCILECPLCDRTWFYKKFKKRELHEIDIDSLIRFFDGVGYKVTMCGNNGDPIYHSDFHTLCNKLKSIGCELKIVTNGSKKSKSWWEKLGNILDTNDSITFSIDGLIDTNKIYRVNSDYDSIIKGFETIKGKVKTIWKFIVFKHNQHQIHEAKTMSKQLGFDEFELEKSNRWWEKNLMPDEEFVDPTYKYQIEVAKNNNVYADMKPKCLVNDKPKNGLYIDSAGDFYPCCWTGLYGWRHKDIFDPRQNKFNIKNNSATEILNNKDVKEFFIKTKNYDSASKCCKIYCGVSNG